MEEKERKNKRKENKKTAKQKIETLVMWQQNKFGTFKHINIKFFVLIGKQKILLKETSTMIKSNK